MTIESAFKKIFNLSLITTSNSIKSCSNFEELNSYDNNLFRTNLIYNIIGFFAKTYEVDIMPMYLDYMKKCNEDYESTFCNMFESY